ncbi:hypothetical protein C2845_PM17G03290 [Panicum miliaceum]|uniref:DUF1618 domain-containing protein n=1 Tax=Panicum miliaceum TaxID=4540 RepID=A0A3L6Q298_PANMI|nr:hypothetical protein C2845_PM17G03290 [Panicum miliaceum]
MNLLRRLGLQVRSLDALSLLSRRPSTNALRSGDPVPTSPPPPAATKDTRWAMLNRLVCRMDGSVAADDAAAAESHTATGRHLRVSLSLAAPPSSSFLHYDWVTRAPSLGDEDYLAMQPTVVAAHDDSVLFEMVWRAAAGSDYFVYRAGGVGRPPSLSRLPTRDVTVYVEHRGAWERREIELFSPSTGILRRGEEELLELWAFPGYEGLPRVHPECPVMSLHNPDVVYLRVGDGNARPEESKVWIVEVDTRRKALLSITPCTTVAQKRCSRS